MWRNIPGDVVRADLDRLADLPSDEATLVDRGSGVCAGCLGRWVPASGAYGQKDRAVGAAWCSRGLPFGAPA